ncbi:MAG: shikimate dehydrogenase [Chloroflexi bacterium]|nr:shikimate dehydrogenase [Chloroflexota bacterium]
MTKAQCATRNTQYAIRSTQSAITGATRLTGVIGWPVSHSLSPPMHNAAFAALGLNWVYVPLSVPPERVEAAVRGLIALGFAGANVTVPHKSAVVPFMDELTPTAAAIGAVNTIVVRPDGTLLGDSTDGVGFMADLREHGQRMEEGQRIEADKRMMPENSDVTSSPCHPVTLSPCQRVLVLGAGGAARGVVYALAEAGATVAVVNRTLAHAEKLCQTIGWALPQAKISAHPFPAALPELAARADLIVNTTSLGLHEDDPLPWLLDLPFRDDQTIYDLIYSRPTPLLALAEQCGARAINGLGMLVHQGARSFELWTGQKAPVDVMLAVLRET